MLFFDSHVAHMYTSNSYVFVENLKEIFFPKKSWIQRKLYLSRLQKSLTKAQKVLCFDIQTALELNEKLDIKEENIAKIP